MSRGWGQRQGEGRRLHLRHTRATFQQRGERSCSRRQSLLPRVKMPGEMPQLGREDKSFSLSCQGQDLTTGAEGTTAGFSIMSTDNLRFQGTETSPANASTPSFPFSIHLPHVSDVAIEGRATITSHLHLALDPSLT